MAAKTLTLEGLKGLLAQKGAAAIADVEPRLITVKVYATTARQLRRLERMSGIDASWLLAVALRKLQTALHETGDDVIAKILELQRIERVDPDPPETVKLWTDPSLDRAVTYMRMVKELKTRAVMLVAVHNFAKEYHRPRPGEA